MEYDDPLYFSQTPQLFTGDYSRLIAENTKNIEYSAFQYIEDNGILLFLEKLDNTLEDYLLDENFEEEVFLKSGMVRASVGLYNTRQDIANLISALKNIISNKNKLSSHYQADSLGNYFHSSFHSKSLNRFSTASFIQSYWDTHSHSD